LGLSLWYPRHAHRDADHRPHLRREETPVRQVSGPSATAWSW